VLLDKSDKMLLKNLILELDSSLADTPLAYDFMPALEVLYNWPVNMPLFASIDDDGKLLYSNDKLIYIKNKDTVPLYSVSESEILCDYQGEEYSVNWHDPLYDVDVEYTGTIGEDDCFARCGVSCLGELGYLRYGSNAYTADCAEHDACVRYYNMIYWLCDAWFLECIDDYWAGRARGPLFWQGEGPAFCGWEGN
jgi:hypothetical protein